MDDGRNETELAAVRHKETIEDVQREILLEAKKALTCGKAKVLTFPNASFWESDPDYEHGSQVQFISLRNSDKHVKDEVCIAFVDNQSTNNSRSLGSDLGRSALGIGEHSRKEIAVMRWTQTPEQKRARTGTYTLVVLSDTDKAITGTFSVKFDAHDRISNPQGGLRGLPNFASRWEDGSAQLMNHANLAGLGRDVDFLASDYEEILRAMKTGVVDEKSMKRICDRQNKFDRARKEEPSAVSLVTPERPRLGPESGL